MEEVILVDKMDNPIGRMEKLAAHQQGKLHRAFSVLLFNSKGEILLQKRALDKYHSAGLWTNTCCSHPYPNEKTLDAAKRRLREEMGIDASLSFSHVFIYRAELEKNLVEHELDHVYIGEFNGHPVINKAEVADWKYASVASLRKDMAENPDVYTYWFKLIMRDPQLKI